jgi:peptidoglycan/xylan/chitin deacetylase (PgdA/CDA1 family)
MPSPASAVSALRDAFLHVSKWCGLFALSRMITRKKLRILCYHGFATGDEVRFRPGLFITPATFEKRLRTLRSQRYEVVSLSRALASLDSGSPGDRMTVLTVDDGFHGFNAHAVKLLEAFAMPVTVYVTSYYAVKQTPVFRLVVQYMFWKTTRDSIDLGLVSPSLSGTVSLEDPGDPDARNRAAWQVINVGESQPGEEARLSIESRLGELLAVDFGEIQSARAFSLMTLEEIRTLARGACDVQLHTHRHRLPESEEQVKVEIGDNRRVLEPVVGAKLDHLCYPSGIWFPALWPWLKSLGIRSATTCEAGLNDVTTPRLGLKRILDGEDVSQIGFEAEISGYKDLLRKVVAGKP